MFGQDLEQLEPTTFVTLPIVHNTQTLSLRHHVITTIFILFADISYRRHVLIASDNLD